eukprot:Platyproteum_vivax@DN665_c0_g1_i1.p1
MSIDIDSIIAFFCAATKDIGLSKKLIEFGSQLPENKDADRLLNSVTTHVTQKADRKKYIRIYTDGVYDLTHSGHFNAIRQAAALGDYLVVGVVSDEEATKAKGKPIYSQQERTELIKGCKWVDEVVEGTPYKVTCALLDKYNCDYAAHGDDLAPCADGTDSYAEVRNAKRLLTFRRTEGVSTTKLISQLLLACKQAPRNLKSPPSPQQLTAFIEEQFRLNCPASIMSTQRLMQFMPKSRRSIETDTVVYVDGSFDLFHVGHLKTLLAAKAMGGTNTFLLVGIHDDDTVRKAKGSKYPLMGLLERTLGVLAMACVDEVIIGAPWEVTKYLIESQKISLVVKGTTMDGPQPDAGMGDPYSLARQEGKLREIPSAFAMTTRNIEERIIQNREQLLKCIGKRQTSEANHYTKKSQHPSNFAQEI